MMRSYFLLCLLINGQAILQRMNAEQYRSSKFAGLSTNILNPYPSCVKPYIDKALWTILIGNILPSSSTQNDTLQMKNCSLFFRNRLGKFNLSSSRHADQEIKVHIGKFCFQRYSYIFLDQIQRERFCFLKVPFRILS